MTIGHNGGPRLIPDEQDIKMTWIRLDIQDFRDGVRAMSMEMRGYYISFLLEMYDGDGSLTSDLYHLGKVFGTTARVMKRVADTLLSEGKIYLTTDGRFRNRRCDEEREKLIAEYCRRHQAAVRREEGKRRSTLPSEQKVSAKLSEVSAKPSEVSAKLSEVSAKLLDVSAKLDDKIGKFQESFAKTFQKSQAKSTLDEAEVWQTSAAEQHQNCAPRRKKKEEEEKELKYPPTPLEGGGGVDRKTSKREIARIAFAEWQEFAKAHDLSVPRDASFNDNRARDIYARMAEHAGPSPTGEALLAVWREALVNVAKSKMLRGMTEIAFRADLTFLCQRKSFQKLIEGGYGNGACASDARWSVPSGSHASRPDWSSWDDNEWQHQIEKHGVEYWPVDKLAGPPGSKTYVGPKAMEPSLCEVYRPDGMRRQR